MTHGAYKDLISKYAQGGIITVSLDDGTLDLLLNRAYQFAYQYAVFHSSWFYSKTFDSTSTGAEQALPPDFFRPIAMLSPDARNWQVRMELNLNEVDTIISIPNVTPTVNNPLFTVIGTDVVVYPTGIDYTLFYISRFGRITNNATEINDLGGPNPVYVPILFKEIIIQKAQIYVHERALTLESISAEDREQQSKLIKEIEAKLTNDLKPLVQANKKANTA